jgi:hypothetical protein
VRPATLRTTADGDGMLFVGIGAVAENFAEPTLRLLEPEDLCTGAVSVILVVVS